MSKINWTEKTWNPVIGCSRVSEGCRNCYAERLAVRMSNMGKTDYDGLTNGNLKKPRWTGEVRFLANRLHEPFRYPKRGCLVFVNSMSDLLHHGLTVDEIDQIVDVMRKTPQHTYQILTKRPERLAELHEAGLRWPSNVWLGVSVEDQRTANERIPLLTAERYAAVLWASYEPALGPVDWEPFADDLDWIVVGGESGPRCRPMALHWVREVIDSFHGHAKPVFVKQIGGKLAGGVNKGDDPQDWPEDIRVREYPSVGLNEGVEDTEAQAKRSA